MAGSRLSTWLLLGMVVVGIYVLPSVTARFAGSHTMEYNATSEMAGLDCGGCHQYMRDEINSSTLGDEVMDAHFNALTTANYANATNDTGFATNSSPLLIGPYNASTIANNQTYVCYLCHEVETNVAGGHTQVVTRVCTDRDCHGLNSGDVPMVFTRQNITEKLSQGSDAHSGWYTAMNGSASVYARANSSETTANYTAGFYVCLGCHTRVGLSMNLSRPQVYNINISVNSDMIVTVSAPQVNFTTTNDTFSLKPAWLAIWS